MSAPAGTGASRSSSDRATLRQLVESAAVSRQPVLLPGCYDALGARIIEQAGFDAVYMTGFGTTAGLLAQPDIGLLGLAEMADNAARIVSATSLPVLADADTGYGNEINVARTVQVYEQAGVGGLHIEDQAMPKRCGHMDNKTVIATNDMVTKISAAVAARSNPDLIVIARTDARAPNGLADAIDRGHRFREAGADMLFIEALEGVAEIEQVATEFADTPLLFNWVEGGKTPALTHAQIAELGFATILMPVGLLLAATAAMQTYAARIKVDGTPAEISGDLMGFTDFTNFIGLPEALARSAGLVD